MKKLSSIVIAALTLMSIDAAAANLAALQYDIGKGVDTAVRGDIESALADVVKSNSKWTLIDVGTSRSKMNPIVRDCFTNDCLVKAGKEVGADAGIRMRFTGEAQIYDWTLETYDLRSGALLETRKGACELCGRSEVVRTFKATATDILNSTSLGSAKKEVKPKAEPKVEPTKPVEVVRPSNTGDVQLVKIEISVEPPDATITFRDAVIGRGRATAEVGPGNHEFTFEAPDHRIIKELVVVEGDNSESMALRVHLPKKDAAAKAVEVSTRGPVDKWDDREFYGWVGVGSGAVLLVGSLYLNAIDGDPTCDGNLADCPDLYDTDGLAFVTTFAGTALLTTGVVLLIWEKLAGDSNPNTVKVAPTIVPAGAGIGVFGRF